MATPLSAAYRIELPYVQNGLTHHINAYCDVSFENGDSSILVSRSGADVTLQHAVDGLSASLVPFVQGAIGAGTLFKRVTGAWVPLGSRTAAVTPTGTAANCVQFTLVLRCTDYTKVKVVIMESNQFGLPFHAISYASLSSGGKLLVDPWTQNAPTDIHPWAWQIGRSGAYLADLGVVGVTTDLNDKIRRARGLV